MKVSRSIDVGTRGTNHLLNVDQVTPQSVLLSKTRDEQFYVIYV